MKNLALFTILMLISISFSVEMLEPVNKEIVPGEEIFLGTIGPGQTLQLNMNPWIYEGEEYVAHYDLAVAEDLPDGWKSTDSKLYGDPLQVTISASEKESEGMYEVKVIIIDAKKVNGTVLTNESAEGVHDVEFKGIIQVQHEIMDVNIEPKEIVTGANQPSKYYITITNKGSASDVFKISSNNIPKWTFEKLVYIPPKSSKTVIYEIVESEEEIFHPIITVVSTSSSIIEKEEELTFTVQSDLFSDFKAVNNGISIFPILEEPIFALMGLLSNLW